jgi:DNA-directed RNA polymerase specialized sigma24 family protein
MDENKYIGDKDLLKFIGDEELLRFIGYVNKQLLSEDGEKDGLLCYGGDIVQESLLKAIKKYDPAKGKFTSLLYKIADDEIVNVKREVYGKPAIGDLLPKKIEGIPDKEKEKIAIDDLINKLISNNTSGMVSDETWENEGARIVRLERLNFLEQTPADELPESLRKWKKLTSSEFETLRKCNELMDRGQVSEDLNISRESLRQRISRIISKLGGNEIAESCHALSEILRGGEKRGDPDTPEKPRPPSPDTLGGREWFARVRWFTDLGRKAYEHSRQPHRLHPELPYPLPGERTRRASFWSRQGQTETNLVFGTEHHRVSAEFVNGLTAASAEPIRDFQDVFHHNDVKLSRKRLKLVYEVAGLWERRISEKELEGLLPNWKRRLSDE